MGKGRIPRPLRKDTRSKSTLPEMAPVKKVADPVMPASHGQ
jgi:hypothetical protein